MAKKKRMDADADANLVAGDFPKPPTKSAMVKAYLAEHPEAGPKEVVAALKEKGVEVTTGLVSNIKSTSKPKTETAKTETASPAMGIGDAVEEVARLASKVGGIDQLAKIVNAMK